MGYREILGEALDLLGEDGDGWTQGGYAVDSDGKALFANNPNAVAWCAIGAIFSVGGNEGIEYNRAVLALDEQIDGSIQNWNDAPGRTFSQVREVFRRAQVEGCSARGETALVSR